MPLEVDMIAPTAKYDASQYDQEQFNARHQMWQTIDDDTIEALKVLTDNEDVEHMWKLWNQKTEMFPSKLYPTIPAGRPKGSMPRTKKRAVTAPSNAAGADTARQKRLRKLFTRLSRMRILIAKEEIAQALNELTKFGNITASAYNTFFEDTNENIETKTSNASMERSKDLKASKLSRVHKWRDNCDLVFSSLPLGARTTTEINSFGNG